MTLRPDTGWLLAGILTLGLALPACRKTAPAPLAPATSPAGPASQSTAPAWKTQIVSIPEEPAETPFLNGVRGIPRRLLDAARLMRAAHKDIAHQAPTALGEAVRYLARDVRSHIAAGDRALTRDDYATAVECFYRAVDLEPENLDALQGLAVALAASERFEEALPIYKMVIALAGDDAAAGVRHPGVTARFNLAVAYSRLKRFRDAIETYRELVRDREDYVQAWYNLAGIYQAEGKLLESRDAWRQVVKLNPQYVNAYSQLGEVLIDLGSPAEAVKAYAEAARLSPDAAAWSNLAGAAQAAGNLGQAAVALKRALDCDSRDASLWMRLGDVLLGMHRTAGDPKLLKQAVDAWRESLRLNGDQKKVQELIRTYERVLTSRPSTAPTQPK